MKFEIDSSRAAALVAFIASVDAAHHGHHHHHRAHHHETRSENVTLEKKSGLCQFPTNLGLVPVTPNAQNAGWAMSPNQPCLPGNYCPYACPSGQVMMQWDPLAISYTYPLSMNGGLYCDLNGDIQKPFPNKPYCQDGTGAIQAINQASQPVAFCQTVLPGNEAMLIPTLVEEVATLAVPGTSYWCETAAQYYINAPGVSAEEGCVWGTSANPFGNWSPYTAGGNTVADGTTYMKIGWNPIYLQATTPFRSVRPNFGIKIECEGPGCNGVPCSIDPSSMAVNVMDALNVFTGAGGATGCVVTVPPGSKANIVTFDVPSGDSSSSGSSSSASSSSSSSTDISTPTPTPTPTSSSPPTEAPTSSPTPTETPSETSTATPTPTPTPSPSSRSSSSSTSTGGVTSTKDYIPTSVAAQSSTQLVQSSPSSMSYTYRPHVFAPSGSAEISAIGASATAAAASATSAAAGTGVATSTTVPMMSVVFAALAAIAMNF